MGREGEENEGASEEMSRKLGQESGKGTEVLSRALGRKKDDD